MIKNFLSLAFCFLFLGACSKSAVTDSTSGVDSALKINLDEKTCTTPWGEVLHSGEVRKAYKLRTLAACTDSCEKIAGTLTCADGVLSGGTDLVYDRCEKPMCGCSLDFLASKPQIKHGDWITLYRSDTVQCDSCDSVKEARQCNDGVLSGTSTATKLTCQALPCKNCALTSGATLNHGQKSFFYSTSTGVSCKPAARCDAVKTERTCQNGTLSGDASYPFSTCTDQKCSCTLDNKIFPSGTTVAYYSKSSLTCADKQSCTQVQSTAICNDGVLPNVPATAYATCTKQSCNCQYTDYSGANKAILDGNSLTVYTSASPGCGLTCVPGKVTCNAGVLSGDVTSKYLNCSTSFCYCQTPWGSSYPAVENPIGGNFVSFYQNATSVCGKNKCSEIANNSVQYACKKDGTNTYWIDQSSNKVTDFGGYKYAACVNPVCSCSAANRSIPEGGSLTLYKQNSVACGQSCEGAGKSISIRCNKGLTMDISPSGADPNLFTSGVFDTCQMAACPTTGTPDAVSAIDGTGDGAVGDGGGSGGGLGDGNGPGFHFSGRDSGAGGGGGAGTAVQISFDKLNPFGEGCALPWGDGSQAVTHLASVVAFSKTSVTSGDKCSKYRFTRTCISGKLQGNTAAIYLNCVEP